ncbi:tyrosine-type recombinase/integrase [Pseudofrankia sp. BMG5.37]|uniref:tyrosine-type recombinase/integrase n=1 Tax=Pseudofrankia sp. BMG5.37 TaxID=3050035 RepID=UPI002894B511|nr:tyrosine-type recombinase/integrase [Pseudofrankia sp. BMG5.37]MDT3446195.1 tyrosine-type recombinase/integrase [Pseudofrankia sp. BMG5.37]
MTRSHAGGAPPDDTGPRTTFDVRVYSLLEVKGKGRSTWQVRWQVAGRPTRNSRNFPSKTAAESRRAEILTAVRKGEAFEIVSGLPISEWHALNTPEPAPQRTWLTVARDFADTKWAENQAPSTRRAIASQLSVITPALFDEPAPATIAELVREALVGWVFVTGTRTTLRPDGRRVENEPPPGWVAVLAWMERHSRPILDLTDIEVTRAALTALSRRLDGKPAAPNTVTARLILFGQVVRFALARGDLDTDPLPGAQWTPPSKVTAVDRRVVVDHVRATRLLAAVAQRAPELEAFYASIYYAAARPGEANELNISQLSLPQTGWGEVTLTDNNPEISPRWSDDPEGPRRARQLKHREKGVVRHVPLHPELVALLRRHIERFGTAPDGRLFRTRLDGPIKTIRHLEVWRTARTQALTPAEAASPLARRPYDLRHAAVSRWLNAGVPATQVAEWAGHSVRVLLTVYAKCIVGQEQHALRLIDASFATEAPDTPDPATQTPAPDPTTQTLAPDPSEDGLGL